MAETLIINLKELSEVADIISGFAFKSSEFSKNGVPIIRISNITDHEDVQILDSNQPFFSGEINEKISKYLLKDGDILIALSGATTGKIGLYKSKEKALLNQRIALIRPKDGKSYKFLYYFLQTMGQKILQDAYGGAQPNISPKTLEKYKLNFPETESERNKIVDEIEKQFTRLDASVKDLKNVKDKFEVYKKSVLKEVFEPSNDFKYSELKTACDIISGYAFKSTEFIKTEGVNVVKITNVSYNCYVDDKKDFLPQEYLQKYKKFWVEPNTILLTLTRPITNNKLKVCIYPENKEIALLNQRVAKIIPKKDILKKYLVYYLQSEWFKIEMKKGMTETLQPNLSPKKAESFKFPNCDINTQEQIINKIESIFSVIDNLKEVIDSSLNKTDQLRKSILKSAFEGKLVKEVIAQ